MVWTKSLHGLPHLTQEYVDKWLETDSNIPKRKRVKGYSLYLEGYIHDVEVKIEGSESFVRAKSFPALRKNDCPYRLMVTLSSEDSPIIRKCSCGCKAGKYNCSHCIALLYLLCQFQKQELLCIPPIQSKTSRPQVWNIPQRTDGLHAASIDSIEINKVKPSTYLKQRKRKRKVTEGVLTKTYCPVQEPIPHEEFSNNLLQQLSAIHSDAQVLRFKPDHSVTKESRFGPVPIGSIISYQQKKITPQKDIIIDSDQPTFPHFQFPQFERMYSTVLNQDEADTLSGLEVTEELSRQIEMSTREQSHTRTWHDVRHHRLTSSIFKDVCSRKANHDKLASRLLCGKNIQTAQMKFGIAEEPKAAKLYAEVTGNNVFLSGFVINPSAFHLGTSPDRKVFDHDSNPSFGLLEIKCSVKDNFAMCDFLSQKRDGTFKLKCTHRYFYQVMGQMALTGMKWCDFIVKCKLDYHKERIFFDNEKWDQMKCSLDSFFFQYYLPAICANNK